MTHDVLISPSCQSISQRPPVQDCAMRTNSQRFRLTASVAISSVLLAQLLPPQAYPQGPPPPPPMSASPQMQQGGDPPARVGRLSQVNGTVSFHTQDETEWNAASLNYPVTAGNAFWTD